VIDAAQLEHCPNATIWKPSCKRRNCSFCGPKWARDWGRNLRVNLEHLGGPVATIAITGPGSDRLPWDEEHCKHRRPHKHSGSRFGCRVQDRALREWSDTLSYRWQLLRQAARIATKRELGYAPPWVLARVWEPQKRGVPHLHLVVPYGSFAEKRTADVFRKHLARLAKDYDFGHVQGRLAPIQGRDAARYVANYMTGRSTKKSSIRSNIADYRLPRSLIWLTPKLTRETLVTMRTLRRARHLWASMAGICDPPVFRTYEDGLTTAVAFRSVYPQRAGPLGEVELVPLLEWARECDRIEARQQLAPPFWAFEELRKRSGRITAWAARETGVAA
jgi:hypothetical protein